MRAAAVLAPMLAGAAADPLLVEDPYTQTQADLAAAAPRCGKQFTPFGPEKCVFGDHMVLASNDPWGGQKEGPPAKVWGFGAGGEVITISGLPDGKAVTATANSAGNWSTELSFKASADAYNLTFNGTSQSVTIHDVMFGDTWLCSGQSNMDMSVNECLARNETIAGAVDFPEIRLKNQGTAPWTEGTGDRVKGFSATCYFTAIGMKRNIPALAKRAMGLVRSSVGGTAIEMWMTPEMLEKAGVPAANATDGERSCNGQANSQNYDNLVAPLIPFVFKGMMWYQGESNVGCNAKTDPAWLTHYYARLFPTKIAQWRAAFGVPSTYLFVQLAPWAGVDELPSQRTQDAIPVLRQDQLAALKLPRVGTAVTMDLGDDGVEPWTPPGGHHGGIHPRNKSEVGRRMALQYAAIEGLVPGIVAGGPEPAAVARQGATGAAVTLAAATSAGAALAATEDCVRHGKLPAGHSTTSSCCQTVVDGHSLYGFPFELGLANGTTVLARAAVAGRTVSLTPAVGSLNGTDVDTVRYSWQAYPLCVLRNEQGLPMTPFTTAVSR